MVCCCCFCVYCFLNYIFRFMCFSVVLKSVCIMPMSCFAWVIYKSHVLFCIYQWLNLSSAGAQFSPTKDQLRLKIHLDYGSHYYFVEKNVTKKMFNIVGCTNCLSFKGTTTCLCHLPVLNRIIIYLSVPFKKSRLITAHITWRNREWIPSRYPITKFFDEARKSIPT